MTPPATAAKGRGHAEPASTPGPGRLTDTPLGTARPHPGEPAGRAPKGVRGVLDVLRCQVITFHLPGGAAAPIIAKYNRVLAGADIEVFTHTTTSSSCSRSGSTADRFTRARGAPGPGQRRPRTGLADEGRSSAISAACSGASRMARATLGT
jgi:hypothetical protein